MTVRSMTYAQRAKRALERAGISTEIGRTPQELSARGCGYYVRISENRLYEAKKVLSSQAIPIERIYRRDIDGRFTEVRP